MGPVTVTELLDALQAIEADGHGDARLYAYLGPDGLKVQAEGSHPSPGLVGIILKAPIKISGGAEVIR